MSSFNKKTMRRKHIVKLSDNPLQEFDKMMNYPQKEGIAVIEKPLTKAEKETPFTVESLKRRKDAELEIYKLKGQFDDSEADSSVMKVLDKRQNYLLKRLKEILDKRDPEEADLIRN